MNEHENVVTSLLATDNNNINSTQNMVYAKTAQIKNIIRKYEFTCKLRADIGNVSSTKKP